MFKDYGISALPVDPELTQEASRFTRFTVELKSGETVRYYVTGDKKRVTVAENSRLYIGEDGERDENRAYYCAKLEELAENFRVFEESVQ